MILNYFFRDICCLDRQSVVYWKSIFYLVQPQNENIFYSLGERTGQQFLDISLKKTIVNYITIKIKMTQNLSFQNLKFSLLQVFKNRTNIVASPIYRNRNIKNK